MNSKTKDLALLQVVYIFIIPILLMYFNIIPKSFRLETLAMTVLLMIGIMIHKKWSKDRFGVHTKINLKGIVLYSAFVIAGVSSVMFFANKLGFEPAPFWWHNTRFLALFIPLSVLQEIAYRGFLMPTLHDIFPDHTTVILVNAGLFTLLHIIYPEPSIMLPLAFAGGLGFAALYEWYPNLFLVSVAHTILNFVAVLYGFFSLAS